MLHHIVYSRWSPLLFITTYSCFLLTSCSGGILNYSLCLQSRVITSSHFVRPSMCCSLVTQFSKKQSYGNLQNSCLGIILCQFPRGKINRLCILFCSRFVNPKPFNSHSELWYKYLKGWFLQEFFDVICRKYSILKVFGEFYLTSNIFNYQITSLVNVDFDASSFCK